MKKYLPSFTQHHSYLLFNRLERVDLKISKSNAGFSQHHFRSSTSDAGFTLIEIVIYIVIAAALLTVISSLVLNIFNARENLIVSNELQENARFIFSFVNNEVHNTYFIDDVSPLSEKYYFYKTTSTRFSLTEESGDLVYRLTQNTGSGFPDQSTADPQIINSNRATISNFDLLGIADQQGNPEQGVEISFTITIGDPSKPFSYASQDFSTFISIR